MENCMYQDELYHHGIKGQRWGIRRYQNKDGSLTDAGRQKMLSSARKNESKAERITSDSSFSQKRKARLTQKAKEARREVRRSDLAKARAQKQANSEAAVKKKKKISEMTDAELREKINRMELEKNYKRALKEINPETTSRGKKLAMDILENSARNIGTQAATYVMGKGANKVLGMIFDDMDAINPKKGQKDK